MDLPVNNKSASRVQEYKNSLSYNGTETCSADDDIPLGTSTHICDLCTDILALPITIRPYHEGLRPPGFICKVSRDCLRVFPDRCAYRRVEELKRITRAPGRVLRFEVMFKQVSCNGCDGKLRIRVVIIEVKILDIFIGTCSLQGGSAGPERRLQSVALTVANWPPDRICVIDLAIDGFSATHRTLMR